MPDASSLTGTELVPVVQSGANVKTTSGAVAALAEGLMGIKQSTAYLLTFKVFLTATGAEATGQTIAITISKNGATSFSNLNAGATNATEMASGWYKVQLDTTDTNTLGPLAVRGTAAAINDFGEALYVIA